MQGIRDLCTASTVLDVDSTARRISLGMKQLMANPWVELKNSYLPGTIIEGEVRSITDFGVFVGVEDGIDGLVHISELAEGRIERVDDAVKMGDLVEVKCIGVDDKGRVKLSRKAALRDTAGTNGAPGRN
jgi:small subunit ribosomal protein S1